jgi:AcrR family transcriptional regulator
MELYCKKTWFIQESTEYTEKNPLNPVNSVKNTFSGDNVRFLPDTHGGGMVYRRTERGDQRYNKRRGEIVTAARKLFGEQGYEAMTMQQVVREAGTSIGNCYFYFSNKEALLLVVIREIISDIWSTADAELDQVPPGVRKLAIIFCQSITLMLEHEELGRLMLKGLSLPAVRNAILEDYRRRVRQLTNENPDLFNGKDIDLKINAAQGAGIALMEMKLFGELTEDPVYIGIFLARYNLQALGFPREAVELAMNRLEKIALKHRTARMVG